MGYTVVQYIYHSRKNISFFLNVKIRYIFHVVVLPAFLTRSIIWNLQRFSTENHFLLSHVEHSVIEAKADQWSS